jgi:predicted flap endonuclease-1-like 5' DNA nuclease
MIYLSQTLFSWWLAAFALGVAVALAAPGNDSARGRGGLAAALVLLALGATAAFLRVAPGRAGLWLETAVLAGAAYGAGCLCGWAIGAPFAPAPAAAPEAAGRLRAPRAALPMPVPAPRDDAESAAPAGETAAGAQPEAAPAREAPQPTDAPAPPARDLVEEGPASPPPAAERPGEGEGEDDLLQIRGVDAATARGLREIGVWRFSQIAAWGPEHVTWIARHFGPGAGASAEFWPPQAQVLDAGALTDYACARSRGEAPDGEDAAALAAWAAALPRPAPAGASDALYAGARPPGFFEPPFGRRDDLTRISGVDADRAARLNGLGVWSFGQIARWRPEHARWIGAWLATPGAPERDDWIAQARALAARPPQAT